MSAPVSTAASERPRHAESRALDALDALIARGLGAARSARPADDADAEGRSADALRRFLQLAVAVEAWNALRFSAYQEARALHLALAVALALAAALGWRREHARSGAAATGLLLLTSVALTFPFNANHQAAQIVLLLLCALAHPARAADGRSLLEGARWLFVIGFAWAGLQKLLWGYYAGGEFLAHRIASDPNFAQVFGWLLPAEEVERLASMARVAGAGPFRTASPLLAVLSNTVWVAELALPAGLLWRPTRRLAVVGSLGFLVAIELGARELFFGGLMANLALLWWSAALHARALPLFLGVYAYLAAMAVGLLPHWSFG